jgi:ribosome maturation factor RimP
MNSENIKQTLEAHLAETDMFVVDIQVSNDNLIQISLDGDSRVSIDDCIEVARYLEKQYDRDEEDYELRVSTFGIDNPVQHIRQLNKVVGSEILIKKDETPEQRARLEKIDGINLYITYRLKKGGPKAKAQIFKDGESEVVSFDELEYVKEIIRF